MNNLLTTRRKQFGSQNVDIVCVQLASKLDQLNMILANRSGTKVLSFGNQPEVCKKQLQC